MSAGTLAGFFAEMCPFLMGEVTAEALVERLGPSPSGIARLALYPKLVARQHREILDGLFPAVRAGCRLLGDGLWNELTRDFVRANPPGHWEPNHLGQPFAEFLTARRERGPSLPTWLDELADYAWIRFAAAVADPGPDDDGVALDCALFARRYAHDVVAFTTQVVEHPDSPPAVPPQAAPRTVLVGWSHAPGGGVVVVDASLAALVAVARRSRHDASPLGVAGLTEARISTAEADLERWGILAHREVVPR
jgi:hypothetical protein